MKKYIIILYLIILSLIFGAHIYAQVPSIMRIATTDKPIIFILHKNDTCIFQPIYIQLGATCVTNFESFDGMVYMVTNIWGLAQAYVISNQLKGCGNPQEWAYEDVNNIKKLIYKRHEDNYITGITY